MKLRSYAVVLFALALLAALPSSAQTIPAGSDNWVTPGDGQTFLVIPDGELEALCGAVADPDWDHKIPMIGIPAIDAFDWDTAVRRLDKAVFVGGVASTRVQVAVLNFKGLVTRRTPCGEVSFSAHLRGAQPITKMTLRLTHPRGGLFFADLNIAAEIRVYDANSGAVLGGIPFAAKLPSPATGTPFALSTSGAFKPGIDSSSGSESCVPALRAEQSMYPVDSSHYYWIEDLIAQGLCSKRN